jgi:hypothetical protein
MVAQRNRRSGVAPSVAGQRQCEAQLSLGEAIAKQSTSSLCRAGRGHGSAKFRTAAAQQSKVTPGMAKAKRRNATAKRRVSEQSEAKA